MSENTEQSVEKEALNVQVNTDHRVDSDLVFSIKEREILRFTEDGKIFHSGNLIRNASKHVYKGVLQWLLAQQHVFPAIHQHVQKVEDENKKLRRDLEDLQQKLLEIQECRAHEVLDKTDTP